MNIRRYVHLSTGNYNATSARIYTDLGLFTCREDFGEDATDLFNYLTGFSYQTEFKRLLIAPITLRPKLAELIEREIEQHVQSGGGHLMFKMNALVDPDSNPIALSCLTGGGEDRFDYSRHLLSAAGRAQPERDHQRHQHVVGRFLEHSRVYWFRNGGNDELYIGSADMMQRNLDRRVEAVFPILDGSLRGRIRDEVLDLGLRDNVKARKLCADGSYEPNVRAANDLCVDSQMELLRRG